MDCRSVIHSLSDYLDGSLVHQESHSIESHLRHCQPCHTIRLELQEIRSVARELPLHTPPRALWTRIQQEIEIEKAFPARSAAPKKQSLWQRLGEKKFTFSLPQLAGAGVLAACLLTFVAVRSVPISSNNPPIRSRDIEMRLVSNPAVLAMQARIEERLNHLNTRKASWDPQMKQVFDEHLKRIDSSLASTRQALENNEDPDQQQILVDLYKEKLQVLEDFDKLK